MFERSCSIEECGLADTFILAPYSDTSLKVLSSFREKVGLSRPFKPEMRFTNRLVP